jgi:transposase
VDDTGPGGRRGNPPAPSITWGAAPADRQATCPPAHPVAPRPRSLWLPGRALDARTNHGRDSCGIWHLISSAPCQPFVQGPAVEPAKTRPTRPPARRSRDCQVARRDLAGHHKGAQAQGQTSFFVDESGFYPLPSVVRTYAPVGQTPILREWWTRDHLSAISAISPEGKLYFHDQDSAIASAAVVAFLDHLLREVSGRMVIIWDGAPIHRSQVIKQFLANGAAQRLHLERLPAYASELNPGEGLWAQLKDVELRNLCCFNIPHLRHELRDAVKRVRRKPHLIKSFFQGANL